MNHNSISQKKNTCVLFIDMNSFFATCEQQVNYWLRGRPVGVCVYTGKFGCIISPSIEAKAKGIKLGLRLNEAMQICPDLVPLETNPQRYREFHLKIMVVLKKYCEDVIPKSIDEAIVDITDYSLIYKNPVELARKIKADIKKEAGDWMKCSIGIAPNAFLAKLASNLKKPDGLTVITKENIDEILSKLKLTDLPGIKTGMASRLENAGIKTPLELRHSTPEKLKMACHSVIGIYWYHRLNFGEVDQVNHRYKTMQAMRQISQSQRKSLQMLNDLFIMICSTLEKRMVKEKVFCNEIGFFCGYKNGYSWKDHIKTAHPVQDAMEVMNLIKKRMEAFEKANHCEPIINQKMTSMGIIVNAFISDDLVQYQLFEDNVRKDKLRKTVYDIKDKFGSDKIMRGIELQGEHIMKDVIGFGSVKDLHPVE